MDALLCNDKLGLGVLNSDGTLGIQDTLAQVWQEDDKVAGAAFESVSQGFAILQRRGIYPARARSGAFVEHDQDPQDPLLSCHSDRRYKLKKEE